MASVSVIITTYNREKYLMDAVQSVQNQTFTDYELIVIDDGSTGGTSEILKNKNLKYHYQKNAGISAARNAGIKISSGKYICFLDDDDLWLSDKLAVQYRFMENHKSIPLCYTDEKWQKDGRHKNQKQIHKKKGGAIFEKCLKMCTISPSSVMIRREIFHRLQFDEKLPVCEDYDMWLNICSLYEIAYLDIALIIKRAGHPQQLSFKYPVMDRFRIYSIMKILKKPLNSRNMELAKRELYRKSRIVANGGLKRGKLFTALKYYAISKIYGKQN